jgi:hypothetical protein
MTKILLTKNQKKIYNKNSVCINSYDKMIVNGMIKYLHDEGVKEADSLDSFTQTHLISENCVPFLAPAMPVTTRLNLNSFETDKLYMADLYG